MVRKDGKGEGKRREVIGWEGKTAEGK